MFFRKTKTRPDRQTRQPSRNLPPRSGVFSYYEARTPRSDESMRRPSEEKNPRRHKTTKRRLLLAAIVVLIIVGLYYEVGLSSQPDIKILGNEASTSFLQSAVVYRQAASKLLAGAKNNDNKLTINTTSVAEHMQQEFPEIANVSVTIPVFGRHPSIYLELARPVLVLDSLNSGEFVVASSGKALLSLNGTGTDGLKLPTVIDKTGLQISLGQAALSDSDISFIQQVVSQLQAHGISIKSLELPPSSRELDVSLAGASYKVKFNLEDSSGAGQQIGTFLATRKYLNSHDITPVSYIDVRVPGRVYYK